MPLFVMMMVRASHLQAFQQAAVETKQYQTFRVDGGASGGRAKNLKSFL
jgi:hypothetical protein